MNLPASSGGPSSSIHRRPVSEADAAALSARLQTIAQTPAVTVSLTSTDVLSSMLAEARRFLQCSAGALWRVERDHVGLVVTHNDVVPPSALATRSGRRLPLDRTTIPGHVAVTGRPFQTDDVSTLQGEPGYDGTFDEAHGVRTRALLAVPLVGREKRVIGVLELMNPQADGLAREDAVRLVSAQAALALDQTLELARLAGEHKDAVCALATIAEFRDSDIARHVRRISGYSVATARALGLDAATVRHLELASALHDIGKVGIPPSIQFKPGKLTDEEFLVTRDHCAIGNQILRGTGSPLLDLAAEIAHTHHERWDGKGYPGALAGPAVPVAGRIVAVADVFDALTTKRIYKPAIGLEQSLAILQKESGKHFDPEVVDAFQRVFPEVLDVKRAYSTDE